MTVDYTPFSQTFSHSRKNMIWPELDYFLSRIQDSDSLLDIGCGNGRLLLQYFQKFQYFPKKYLGIDLSEGLLSEAKNLFPEQNFAHLDMKDISQIQGSWNCVFLIASFHHLSNISQREKFLQDLYKLLPFGAKVFLTNWDLQSPINEEKYAASQIPHSENEFGSLDFSIKIGNYDRFYHSFSLQELENLFLKAGFFIHENRRFENEKNIVSILEKKL